MPFVFTFERVCLFFLTFYLCTIYFCNPYVIPSNFYTISRNSLTGPSKHGFRPGFTNTLLFSTNDSTPNHDGGISDNSEGANEPLNQESAGEGGEDIADSQDSTPSQDGGDIIAVEQEEGVGGDVVPEEVGDPAMDFDKFNFDEAKYKKIVESFSVFKGPSYSLSEYNQPLPEGCRTILDFLEYPRNFDFSHSTASFMDGGGGYASSGDLDRFAGAGEMKEKRMEGPYMESAYEKIGNMGESIPRRYTTRKGDEKMEREDMYKHLKGVKEFDLNKLGKGLYIPLDSLEKARKGGYSVKKQQDEGPSPGHTAEGEKVERGKGQEDPVPLTRIHPNYFMFDHEGYLQNYIKNLSDYNYELFSYQNKKLEKPSFYLNYEYIKKMPRKFPPDQGHTERVREYFLDLVPSLMDDLVEYIKNDPNKDNTPSPPMHDLSLMVNFKQPEYLSPNYSSDFEDDLDEFADEEDYLKMKEKRATRYQKYASLKGLHEPENDLIYPYHDFEPILYRQLLSTYLEMFNTGDLGPIATYKKYKSMSQVLKRSTFKSYSRPPVPSPSPEDTLEDEDEEEEEEQTTNVQERVKVYEKGKKKRALALVYLEPGNGHMIINDRDGYQYMHYQEKMIGTILDPLNKLRMYKKFNVVAKVKGGGITGQSVAIKHALVKYLYRILSPKLKPILRRFDMVTLDRRRVERKKTNLRKARKKEKYSKR